MFLGHWAVGLAAKRAAPRVSLGTLFLAAQFLDLLWPTLLLVGVEHVVIAPGTTRVSPLDFTDYPVTHSLAMAVLWGALVGGAHFARRRSRRSALICAALVPSHWFLDAVVHRPDLPLIPGGDFRVGLELWRSFPATLTVELALLAIGVTIYVRCTKPSDGIGRFGLVGLVSFLLVIELGVFGPPPPSVSAIAWAGHLQWLFVAWGYWLDGHRQAATQDPRPGDR